MNRTLITQAELWPYVAPQLVAPWATHAADIDMMRFLPAAIRQIRPYLLPTPVWNSLTQKISLGQNLTSQEITVWNKVIPLIATAVLSQAVPFLTLAQWGATGSDDVATTGQTALVWRKEIDSALATGIRQYREWLGQEYPDWLANAAEYRPNFDLFVP